MRLRDRNRASQLLEARALVRPDERGERQDTVLAGHVDRIEVDAPAPADRERPREHVARNRRPFLVREDHP